MTLGKASAAGLVALALILSIGAVQAPPPNPLDDALATIATAQKTVAAEVAKLQATNATLLAQTAELKARIATAETNVAAYVATHKQLAARINQTTVLLGGTPPAPVPNNVGATLTASFTAMEAAAKAAMARPEPEPEPQPEPQPSQSLRSVQRLRIVFETPLTAEQQATAITTLRAWLAEQNLVIDPQQSSTITPLAAGGASAETYPPYVTGRGWVAAWLVPQSTEPYAGPAQSLLDRLAGGGLKPMVFEAR